MDFQSRDRSCIKKINHHSQIQLELKSRRACKIFKLSKKKEKKKWKFWKRKITQSHLKDEKEYLFLSITQKDSFLGK